jgi:AcrR family transcriptional regulator
MALVKVQKSEWLNLGAAKFSDKGLEGIIVEQMARQLKCNKASFYWHFNSKEQFLNDMISHWFENSVQLISKKVQKQSDPNKRFENFLRTSFQDKSRKDFMFFLRKLAINKPPIHDLLKDLTKKRLEFTAMLLQDLGYPNSESIIKAEILLNFYVGWYEFNKYDKKKNDRDVDEAIQLIKHFIKF